MLCCIFHRSFPNEAVPLLLRHVVQFDLRKQVLTTFVVVACDALMHFSAAYATTGKHRDVCLQLMDAVLPWTLSYLGSIRGVAQLAVRCHSHYIACSLHVLTVLCIRLVVTG